MIWHATRKCTEPGKMQHPVDGRAWKNFATKYPDFAKEPRNVRLGLAADGFNPFGNLSQAYSMWPVILTTYNLPPWLCMKESSFMLMLLIHVPKSPGKDIDVYLRHLIEDLKSGQGYKAYPTCNKDIPYVLVLSKTAYVGHKRFLKKPHKWRSLREFNGQTDNRYPPKEFGRDEILAQLDRLPTCLTGKHPSFGGVKIKCNVLVELNWTRRSIFYELEYWSFLTLRHKLDIMHIEENVLKAILNTLLMNDKSKDIVKARQDLQRLGIRSGLWLGQTKNGKCLKPQAVYSFTPENQKKFYNDKDPEVSTTNELFALACGPTWTPISINSCVVDGVRYVVHSRDERRITQNSSIFSPGPVGEMYYGQLQEILEFKHLLFKVVLFRVKWFDTRNQDVKSNVLSLETT
nr:hypothetical protein [Tanacetum cinerariifolium]